MIADWSADVGSDSPSIDVPWEGWVDLVRKQSGEPGWRATAQALPECRAYPELAGFLKVLNTPDTATSKVDVFPVTVDNADPEIAEAGEEETRCGLGSYLDVFATRFDTFDRLIDFESAARSTCKAINRDSSSAAEPAAAEIVIRPARIFGCDTFAWSLYAMGYGQSKEAARARWKAAAATLARVFQAEVASSVLLKPKAKYPNLAR